MKFRRIHQPDYTVNITPLIDIIFLLVIFFMVSSHFSKVDHLSLTLPESNTVNKTAQYSLEIVIHANGTLSISGENITSDYDKLLVLLEQLIARGEDKNPTVTIFSDSQASHQSFITVLDVLTHLQLSKVQIGVQKRSH